MHSPPLGGLRPSGLAPLRERKKKLKSNCGSKNGRVLAALRSVPLAALCATRVMANSKVSCSVARTIIGCNGDTLDSAPIEKQFGIRNEQRQDARRARRIIEPKQQRDCRRGGLSHVLPKSFPFRRPRWFVDGSACPGESQTNEAQPHASEWLLFKKTCFKQTRFPSARLCECTPSLTPPHGKLHCQTTRPNEKKNTSKTLKSTL